MAGTMKIPFVISVRFVVKVTKDEELKQYHKIISKMLDENESISLASFNVEKAGNPEEAED